VTPDLRVAVTVGAACFATALLSAIAGSGGGVLLLPLIVAVSVPATRSRS
jgi:uncharacterized membrane protein YfcA